MAFLRETCTVSVLRIEADVGLMCLRGSHVVCPESFGAISGAVGTVCEAVDHVADAGAADDSKTGSSSPNARAFVAVRPPGHHCGEDTPAGFCFVNNVAVGAAHGKYRPVLALSALTLVLICSTLATWRRSCYHS